MENPQLAAALATLEAGTKDLLARINRLPPETPQLRSPQGGWTVAQIVQHLGITEETLILNRYVAAMRRGETGEGRIEPPAQPADPKTMSSRSRKVPTFPELEPASAPSWDEAKARLEAANGNLREAVLACPPGAQHLHPRFGLLPLDVWIRDVAGGHFERHRQQIEEILSQNGH